ncbi:MAG: extracellular solute-binding protein [Oscillospiraceae bacterium]|nr:extracellular solute-binding protein [Oscillospiraceae bacterium]
MKKIVALFLVLILIFTTLISCNSSNKSNNSVTGDSNSTTDPNATAAPGETTTERIDPNLPSEDYGGYTFTFLSHQENSDDWYQPDPREITAQIDDSTGQEIETGDPINDAVYKRNATLEDKYNISFKLVTKPDEKTELSKTVKAGDAVYDAVMMFNNNIPGIVPADLLTDVSKLTYVDLSKPWWDPAVNSMSIEHKNYLLGGDLLILDNEATNALVFNKDLMASLGMDLPYNLVTQGKWTMDVLNQYVKGSSSDLNGDGQMKPDDDRWGFVTFNDTLHALLVSGGGTLALKDDNDIPYMTLTTDRNLSVISKAMDIMYNKQDVLNIQSDISTPGTANVNWFNSYYNAFQNNRALFEWVRMRVVDKFRGMDANFGIIPLPKFDENQANYYSVVNPYTGVLLGVPKSVQDLDRTSVILEAMAAESRYTLQPAYYDIVLQRKYTRDDESQQMLDIIFNSRVYDIGAVYSFGNVFLDFIALCNKSNTDVASYYDKKSATMQAAIDKLVKLIDTME